MVDVVFLTVGVREEPAVACSFDHVPFESRPDSKEFCNPDWVSGLFYLDD